MSHESIQPELFPSDENESPQAPSPDLASTPPVEAPSPSDASVAASTQPSAREEEQESTSPLPPKNAGEDAKEAVSKVPGEVKIEENGPKPPEDPATQRDGTGQESAESNAEKPARKGKQPRRKNAKKKSARSKSPDDQPRKDETPEEAAARKEAAKKAREEARRLKKERYRERKEKERAREAAILEAAEPVEIEGLVEISPKGFGFLRDRGRNFNPSPKDDVFITPEIVRAFGLRDGLWVKCISKQGVRGPQLIELLTINGKEPSEYENLPYFEELTAINPNKAYKLETVPSRTTTRVIDMLAPIGRGQRGLIVAPPRTGKTTLLHHIADAIQENYEEEVHLIVLLVDERPEEVTDFHRSFPEAEIFSSSNDSNAKDHTRIALLAIERAKRLVEAGEHVFILMDSITRLARAFNTSIRGGKRGTASGGLVVGALEVPRRIFAAARNTREAGSLTIVATALIQTNSKADDAIFQEFKGTGNMELVLDRQLSQNYVYPSVDIHKSGTRREELLLPPHVLEKVYVLRRGLGGYKPVDAMEWLLKCMERYDSNAQMLMDIKISSAAI